MLQLISGARRRWSPLVARGHFRCYRVVLNQCECMRFTREPLGRSPALVAACMHMIITVFQ